MGNPVGGIVEYLTAVSIMALICRCLGFADLAAAHEGDGRRAIRGLQTVLAQPKPRLSPAPPVLSRMDECAS